MKLAQLQEVRYAGEHPIVTAIKSSIAKEDNFFMNIKDKEEARAAERGIIAGFGPPDEQDLDSEDTFRNLVWHISNETILQIIDGVPVHKKMVVRRGEPRQTMMNIALL